MATIRRRGGPSPAGLQQRAGLAAAGVVLLGVSWSARAFVLTPPRVFAAAGKFNAALPASPRQGSRFFPIMMSEKNNVEIVAAAGPATATATATAVRAPAAPAAAAAGGGASTAAAAATATAAVQQQANTAIENVDAAAAVAQEEVRQAGEEVVRLTATTVARALPGTWLTAGLPKWMHILRRRMITKEDWMHLHASSGALYIAGGSLYLLGVIGMELFTGNPQLDTTSALPLCVLGFGALNTFSSIPMANTRSWVLSGLCLSTMQLWNAWYVSGAYPASLAPADPWLAAANLSLLVIACVEAEEQILAEKRQREILAQKGRRRTGKIHIRGDDHVEGDAMNRAGSYGSLIFNTPHLYATLVGSGWVERLGEAFPDSPALLFHAYVALAVRAPPPLPWDCGFECEDRVHVLAECRLYNKEREVYMTERGKMRGRYREMLEAWNREERTVAVLGSRKWFEKAGRDIDRIDKLGTTFLSHLWQSRKERLAIGDRSCGNNAPSSRGRVVNGLTAKACKT
ncbi:unnamed protein product [Ectocarpus sp. 6 AP-2014]